MLIRSDVCTGTAGWRLDVHDVVGSTNDVARSLPVWGAVRAEVQRGGRGRFGRHFSSEEGGLWLSAVLPAEGGPSRWAGFSLAIGQHALRVLRTLGAESVRLRWPNDLMSGQKKLAGLLIEQPDPERLIVGIGVNVTNSPWLADPSLVATRLVDLLPSPPDPDSLAVLLLDAMADAHHAMESGGLAPVIAELNTEWEHGRPVELELRGNETVRGSFIGLTPSGDLRLLDGNGHPRVLSHLAIERLREL